MALPSKCPPFLPNALHRLLEETYREPPFAKWWEPREQTTGRGVDGSSCGLFKKGRGYTPPVMEKDHAYNLNPNDEE